MPSHRSGPPAKRLREYATSSDSLCGVSFSNVFQRAWHESKKVIILFLGLQPCDMAFMLVDRTIDLFYL